MTAKSRMNSRRNAGRSAQTQAPISSNNNSQETLQQASASAHSHTDTHGLVNRDEARFSKQQQQVPFRALRAQDQALERRVVEAALL